MVAVTLFPTDVYTRWFQVDYVHDGDTVMGRLDLGFHVTMAAACRLAGINAIELAQPGGTEARDYLASLIPAGARLSVSSVKADKYEGRFDGLLWLPSGATASQQMIDTGYAVAWNGQGKKPVPPWPIPIQPKGTR